MLILVCVLAVMNKAALCTHGGQCSVHPRVVHSLVNICLPRGRNCSAPAKVVLYSEYIACILVTVSTLVYEQTQLLPLQWL